MAAGALGCSISGAGPDRVRLGRGAACRSGARRRWSRHSARHGLPIDAVDIGDRERRRPNGDGLMTALQLCSTRGPAPPVTACAGRSPQGLAPDGGLYVPAAAARGSTAPGVRRHCSRAARHRARRARRLLRRRPAAAPQLARRSPRRRSISRRRRRRCEASAGPAARAGAVPRTDRGLQGFRRALPRGEPASGCEAGGPRR